MKIYDEVEIVGTNDVWEGMTGTLEYIDGDFATVLVDFKDDKQVRQDFSINNLKEISTTTEITENKNKGAHKMKKSVKSLKALREQRLVENGGSGKLEALAKYLGISPEDIIAREGIYNNTSVEDCFFEIAGENEHSGEEYIVANEEDAWTLAKESIEDSIDDVGGIDKLFVPDWLDYYVSRNIDMNVLKQYMKNDVQESMADYTLADYVREGIFDDSDFEEDEDGYVDYTSPNDHHVDEETGFEKYFDENYDNVDPLQYFEDAFGDRERLYEFLVDEELIDIEDLAEESIAEDGIAHELARYDGKEIDLGNGLFAYRTN